MQMILRFLLQMLGLVSLLLALAKKNLYLYMQKNILSKGWILIWLAMYLPP